MIMRDQVSVIFRRIQAARYELGCAKACHSLIAGAVDNLFTCIKHNAWDQASEASRYAVWETERADRHVSYAWELVNVMPLDGEQRTTRFASEEEATLP